MREALNLPFPPEDKDALYERAGGRCQHPGGCQETTYHKLNIDHLTPVCLGKLLGWSLEQIDDPLNLSLMCKFHHILKDAVTQQVKRQVMFQLNGGNIKYGQHVTEPLPPQRKGHQRLQRIA